MNDSLGVCADMARQRIEDELIRPAIRRLIDEAISNGLIPLTPLEWGRTEIWYVGDLR